MGICFSAQGHLSMSKLPPKHCVSKKVHFMGGYGPFSFKDSAEFTPLYIKNIFDIFLIFFFSATYFTDDVLQPTVSLQSQSSVSAGQQSGMLLASDLDSSLANLVGSKWSLFKISNLNVCVSVDLF